MMTGFQGSDNPEAADRRDVPPKSPDIPNKAWSSLSPGERRKREESSLQYFPPSEENGKLFAQCSVEEEDRNAQEWKHTLVGYIVGQKPPSFVHMKAFVKRAWKVKGRVEVFSRDNGFFYFRFNNEEDCLQILEGGPWLYEGRFMALRRWSKQIRMEKDLLSKIPIWIRLPNLGFQWWSAETISKIASVIGIPLYMDEPTRLKQRLAYARVCIEIDLDCQFPKTIIMKNAEGIDCQVAIEYEWDPVSSKTCGTFGHDEGKCKIEQGVKSKKKWAVKEKQSAEVSGDGFTQVKNARPAEKVSDTTFVACSSNPYKSCSTFGHGEGKCKIEQGVKSKKMWVTKEKQSAQVSGDGFAQVKNARQGHPLAGSSLQQDPMQGLQGAKFVSQSEEKGLKGNKKAEATQRSNSAGAARRADAVKETCEKWRLRGNQDYANGHFSKAEEYYTHGVNCVSPNETSRSCMQALMLCYSNRAATRMSLGRMREALSDCLMAVAIDPGFLKAQIRAGNCHVILGEAEDASKLFKKCLQQGNDVSLDTKILSEASDGLQKAKQVADYMNRAAEILRKRNSDEAKNALEIVSEALSISPLSESLNELKAEALLMLRSYEEVVQLCEQTLDSAEKNTGSVNVDNKIKNVDGLESTQGSPARLWRWRLISKSYFYLGRLEEAIILLEKHEQVGPVIEKYVNKSLGSPPSFSAIIRELLRLKAAGNEAFQAGRHLEAVEHYTAALACNVESRPFAAICFCNRAAAYQALSQMTEAIADCSLAIALDRNYLKAISRRATLHEIIRDYGQAVTDLHRLISLLEQQTEDKNSQSGALERSTSSGNDLKRARHRLGIVEEEGKKGIPLDMYLILGIESSSTAADIKKAYRKAALRHHPDKAGHFLARSENGDDGLWREVADEVHREANRLFKMIGEAYAVLSPS